MANTKRSLDEERKFLADLKQNPTERKKEKFIDWYKGLVKDIASRMLPYYCWQVELDDLIQQGYLGLFEALENYDLNRDNRFSTYAYWRIIRAVQIGINSSFILRTPHDFQWEISQLELCGAKLSCLLGRPCTNEELAVEMDYPLEKVEFLRRDRYLISYDATLDQEDNFNEYSYKETLASQDQSPIDLIVNKIMAEESLRFNMAIVEKCLALLGLENQELLKLWFGLNGHESMTTMEISRQYGINARTIRTRQGRILQKLKKEFVTTVYTGQSDGSPSS